jgi:hypothetical protein
MLLWPDLKSWLQGQVALRFLGLFSGDRSAIFTKLILFHERKLCLCVKIWEADNSDRSVTMAQCTRAFVKGEEYGFSKEAAFA